MQKIFYPEESREMFLSVVTNEFAAKNDARKANFGHNKFIQKGRGVTRNLRTCQSETPEEPLAPDSKSPLYKLSNDVSFDPEFFQEGGENKKKTLSFLQWCLIETLQQVFLKTLLLF